MHLFPQLINCGKSERIRARGNISSHYRCSHVRHNCSQLIFSLASMAYINQGSNSSFHSNFRVISKKKQTLTEFYDGKRKWNYQSSTSQRLKKRQQYEKRWGIRWSFEISEADSTNFFHWRSECAAASDLLHLWPQKSPKHRLLHQLNLYTQIGKFLWI